MISGDLSSAQAGQFQVATTSPGNNNGLALGRVPSYSPYTDGGRGPGQNRPDDAEAIDKGGRGEKDRIKVSLDRRSPTIEGVKKKIAHLQLGAEDLKILLHFAAEWVSAPIVVSVSGDLIKALEVGVGRHYTMRQIFPRNIYL